MKVIKRYRTAAGAGRGLPILRIGMGQSALHIIGFRDLIDAKLSEISVLTSDGATAGNITIGHLDRLGNANHAAPNPRWTLAATSFPNQQCAAPTPTASRTTRPSSHDDADATMVESSATRQLQLALTSTEAALLKRLLNHAILDTLDNATAAACDHILAKLAQSHAATRAATTEGAWQ